MDRSTRRAATVALVSLAIAAVIASCLGRLPGEDPPSYSVEVDNRLTFDLTFAAQIDATLRALPDTVGAEQKGTILPSLGPPTKDDLVFKGQMCTTVDVVALDVHGSEIARHAPGLCLGDTWVIGSPAGGSASPPLADRTEPVPATAIGIPVPTTTSAMIDCGQVKNSDPTFASLPPQHYLLANPDGLFSSCEMAELVRVPPARNGKGGEVLRAGPDVLGRLTFTFTDGVCWDRVLHVAPTLNTTPIPAYTFITGPTLPAGHWFDLEVETVYTNHDPCPAIAASRGARIQLADWPEIPIETSKATPTSNGPGST